ncbi:MAG: DMT family transporter [Thermodesulfobacteriota bacterium]
MSERSVKSQEGFKTHISSISGSRSVIVGAFLISFSGVFVKWAHVPPSVAGFYRTLIGGLVLGILLFIRRENRWYGFGWFFLSCCCGILFAMDLFLWHRSIHYIGPGLSTILANFQVFFLALFGGLILREKPNRKLIAAIPMAMLGLYLLAGVQWNSLGSTYQTGVWLGLATAACYAAYLLVLRKVQGSRKAPSPIMSLMIISLVCAGALGAESFSRGESFAIPDPQTLISLLSYGTLCQVIGWILITKGLPGVPSTLAGLLLLLQPTLSFVWDILFFSRPTTLSDISGALLALCAIYLGTLGQMTKRNSS